LGLIIRTGFCQNLPFAPLVWKFLAGEPITETDVTAADSGLETLFRTLRNDPGFTTEWFVTDWTGVTVTVLDRPTGAKVRGDEIEQFISLAVRARVNQIQPHLAEIRTAFCANLGTRDPIFGIGAFLSRMAQGDPELSVADLQGVAEYESNPADPAIVMFWRVVEQMNFHQRSLLLRFVTTMTRLPLDLGQSFRFRIALLSGRETSTIFPRAGTCYNQLFLPRYPSFEVAFDKITTAIAYTATMENG
jgi:hypothetical protein